MVKREDATQSKAVASGTAVDLAGAVSVLIIGTATELDDILEGDTSSPASAVADADLVAGGPGVQAYIGTKRYLKVTNQSNKTAFILVTYGQHCPVPTS